LALEHIWQSGEKERTDLSGRGERLYHKAASLSAKWHTYSTVIFYHFKSTSKQCINNKMYKNQLVL